MCLVKLNILGSNSAVPTLRRNSTAQILNIDEHYHLIDCGEGTQLQLLKFGLSHFKISHIYISHLHGDHYFGLIGLLNTMGLMGRERPLLLYGPPKLIDIIEAHQVSIDRSFPFPLDFISIPEESSGIIYTHNRVTVYSFPTQHSIPCQGFRFEVKRDAKKLLPEKCKEYGIPVEYYRSIKQGSDYIKSDGTVIPNAALTEAYDFTNYSYAYSADTAYTESLLPHIAGVHTLYHEATYLEDRRQKAHERGHSTALEAGRMAQKAGVQRLVLGHFSSAYVDVSYFAKEASREFENTVCAYDGLELLWPSSDGVYPK